MTFKKYCINRNIEEAVQILEYLESQGVMEEGVLGNLAGRAAKGVVDAGVAVGKRALDTAVSGVGRGAIEGGKRALSVAMGKGKDPAPMIKNAISNLTAAMKLSSDSVQKELGSILTDLHKHQKELATGTKSLGDVSKAGQFIPGGRVPKTTSTAAPAAPAAKPAAGV